VINKEIRFGTLPLALLIEDYFDLIDNEYFSHVKIPDITKNWAKYSQGLLA
jgi:hypothetical protein